MQENKPVQKRPSLSKVGNIETKASTGTVIWNLYAKPYLEPSNLRDLGPSSGTFEFETFMMSLCPNMELSSNTFEMWKLLSSLSPKGFSKSHLNVLRRLGSWRFAFHRHLHPSAHRLSVGELELGIQPQLLELLLRVRRSLKEMHMFRYVHIIFKRLCNAPFYIYIYICVCVHKIVKYACVCVFYSTCPYAYACRHTSIYATKCICQSIHPSSYPSIKLSTCMG